jgi:hypothetical protein
MNTKVRIITVNEGEEPLIRVNSRLPITLEFPSHLVTAYESNGLIFQRVEKQQQEAEVMTQEVEEVEAGSDDETQDMDLYAETQIELYEEEPEVYEETQIELYEEEEKEQMQTQIDCTPPWSAPESPYYAIMDVVKYLSRMEMDDISELQMDLFGNKN